MGHDSWVYSEEDEEKTQKVLQDKNCGKLWVTTV